MPKNEQTKADKDEGISTAMVEGIDIVIDQDDLDNHTNEQDGKNIVDDTEPPPDNGHQANIDDDTVVVEHPVTEDEGHESTNVEDLFMFRELGRKMQAQLGKVADAVHQGLSTAAANLPFTKAQEQDTMAPMEFAQVSEETRLVSSAFRIPAYSGVLDDHGRLGVPVMSAAVKVLIAYSDDIIFTYNPNTTFTIDLQYLPAMIKWRIHRRLLDIIRLHTILTFRHIQGHLPKLPTFPNQLSYLVDVSFLKRLSPEGRAEERRRLSIQRRRALEQYFNELLFILNMSASVELCEFLEMSAISLINWDGAWKYKEGYLRNRVWYNPSRQRWIWRLLLFCIPSWKSYQTKWFIIRSSYIAYVDYIDQQLVSEVLLCDKHFEISVEHKDSKNPLRPMTITIKNGSKKLEVRSESNTQMKYWLRDLQLLSDSTVWCRSHRFGSFCPIRSNSQVRWLIDADEYFKELVKCIDAAKKEVFIHGWWVSPELHLLRPGANHPEARLDRLLQKKAQQGVQVFVMIFKEISISLSINSYHTKVSLERLHPNIRVQRHPDHYSRGILYWAHHEKIVVVDQQVAFTGGLDLCFGRYDTAAHKLTDLGPVSETHTEMSIWTGLDYANPRIRDFRNVSQYDVSMVDRTVVPRMPWHDVHLQTFGQAAQDLARHFIQRWNFVKAEKAMHKETHIPFLLPAPESSVQTAILPEHHKDASCKVQLVRSIGEWSMGMPVEASILDAYLYFIDNASHYILIENQFLISRSSDARHSSAHSFVQNMVASAIVNRIVRAFEEGGALKVIVFLPLMPAFEAALDRAEASSVRVLMQAQYLTISKGPSSILGQLKSRGIQDPSQYISFFSLRAHDTVPGRPSTSSTTEGGRGERYLTEQVYIHSKALIVDDRVAIVGSANINDRSMLGFRDSEIALVVEGSEGALVPAYFDGQQVMVCERVRELRIRLLAEHLGMEPTDELLSDPLSHDFYWSCLNHRAASNTSIYRDLFHCIPDDTVLSWSDYESFTLNSTKLSSTGIYNGQTGSTDAGTTVEYSRLGEVQGRIVQFPTRFLEKEDLAVSILSPEYLLPVEVYL